MKALEAKVQELEAKFKKNMSKRNARLLANARNEYLKSIEVVEIKEVPKSYTLMVNSFIGFENRKSNLLMS